MLRLKQKQFAHHVEEGLRGRDAEGRETDGEWTGSLVLEPRGFQSRVFSTMRLEPPEGLTTTHKRTGW